MILILFLVFPCQIVVLTANQVTPTQTSSATQPIPTFTSPSPTFTFTPTLLPTPLRITPSPSAATPISPGEPFTVQYHPDDALYVGDQVSLEVISPPSLEIKDAVLHVQVDPPSGPVLTPVNFSAWGIVGRYEATLIWAWNTRNLEPGPHTLAFSVQPQGYTWTDQVTLLPSTDLPSNLAEAHWASTQTQCCSVYYVTNTASERDLPSLTTLADEQARDAIAKMGADFTQPITITILPRLLGHGGFTSSEISVSYLDRNYAATSWAMVVHHEMIHVIDAHLGGDFRPTMFVEGLAVYMSGGHYKPEPLLPRAAALLAAYLNWYIPLKTLSDGFYSSQHEIGYLEGASLIEFMVNTYGWQAFSNFYRDIHIHQGESQSDAIDAAVKTHFSITFDQLEQAFLTTLANQTDTINWVDDVRFTVTYFDTMRRYQQLLDPSAYFRTAWLLDNKTMRERGIVADYLRHPHAPSNVALETLLITANQQYSQQDFTAANHTLDVINSVLDSIEYGTTDPFSVSPMAADYLSISSTLHLQGYDVQSIAILNDTAVVDATTSTGLNLSELNLQRSGGQWSLIP